MFPRSPPSPQPPAVSQSSSPPAAAPAPSPTAHFCHCKHKLLGSGLTLESPLHTTLLYGTDPALAQRRDVQVISDAPSNSVPRWHLRNGLPGAVKQPLAEPNKEEDDSRALKLYPSPPARLPLLQARCRLQHSLHMGRAKGHTGSPTDPGGATFAASDASAECSVS